jgi:hypothetical protein
MTAIVHRTADGPPSARWRDTPVAHVAGRIAYLFASDAELQRVAVRRTGLGYIRVEPAAPHLQGVIGVYTRAITLGQLVDDLAGVDW